MSATMQHQNTMFPAVELNSSLRGLLQPSQRMAYILAGNATVTVLSVKTGQRFTYRIRQSEAREGRDRVHFVGVLTGADNTGDYRYLGTIFSRDKFVVTKKSAIGPGAPCAVAFGWLFEHLDSLAVELWHEGSCGRCGRKLTVPESIATGLGPVCAGKEN